MLSSYRVLDLSDERGQLCSHILASLGAEVISIEPPGGTSSRAIAPFADDIEGPESSLWHWSYNRGRKSVVLDLATGSGRDDLLRLVDGADFLIESAGPGVMDELGLGHQHLSDRNPALIMVSISAFGSTGPKSRWAVSDLTIMAAGGQMVLAGDADRAPLRIPLPQAYFHASAEGAGAALIALYERQHHSGLGQHIDCSAQQSTMQASQSAMLAGALNATPATRSAGGVRSNGIDIQLMWPCADGYLSVTFLFGPALGRFSQRLMDWIHQEGGCDTATRDKDWLNYGELLFSGEEPVEEYERVKQVLTDFFATRTKAELFAEAFDRRLLFAPVTTAEDVHNNPHLHARRVWEDIDIGGRPVRFPGRVGIFSETPQPVLAPPPTVGQHTVEVLSEPPRRPQLARPTPDVDRGRSGPALEGLKILDFMWVMAGPAGSRVLADHGANIVRIDSEARLDTARTLAPYRDDEGLPDNTALYSNMNAGKRGLSLDLSKPASRDVVHDLVRWADVVLESFSPKAMTGFGYDYRSLRRVKPDLVMLSSCIMGQTGPYTSLAGYGTMAAAISGFFEITGWPDRAPSGPFGAYTDYTSPRFLVAALLAAVEHHRATGEGQYIDFSQGEASMQQLTPILLDWSVNGRLLERRGNRDDVHAPHGVFRSAGEDQWVAIAVTSDAQWRALCRLIGGELVNDETLIGLDRAGRRNQADELEKLIEVWTSQRTKAEVTETCQRVGVPAHMVVDTHDALADPQLAHRNHFVEVGHAVHGTTWVENTRFHLSRTPGGARYGGPVWGEHSWEILSEELGYEPDRIVELAVADVLA
ncbi:MAG: CaiB/BaiF CoA transferase family protein [Acidimicrobiales bacterium]